MSFFTPFLLSNSLVGIEGVPALASSLNPVDIMKLVERCSASPGDLILFAVGPRLSVCQTLDRLRLFIAHQLNLIDNVSFKSPFSVSAK